MELSLSWYRDRTEAGEWAVANGDPALFATAAPARLFSGFSAGFLARLADLHLGIGHHQADLVRERHQLEAHIDGAHRAFGAAAMNAGIETALAALADDLLIDLQDLRLVAIELRHQTIGEAEIRRADIDAVDALDVEDRLHVLDRSLGLHHRQQYDLVISGPLIFAGAAIHAGADGTIGAHALRRIFGVGDEIPGFLRRVDHRADHAIGAAIQHLADDAGLVPGHAHHRRHRVSAHRLEALHHREIILHTVLYVDGDAVEATLRDDFGGEAGGNREPRVDHRLALRPDLLDLVVCHFVSFPMTTLPSSRGT